MRLLSLSLLVALVGCGQKNSSSVVKADEAEAPAAGQVSDEVAEKLVGTYAVQVDITSSSEFSAPPKLNSVIATAVNQALADKSTRTSTLYRLSTIERDGSSYTIRERNCATTIPKFGKISLTLDPATVQKIDEITTPLEVSGTADKIKIRRGNVTQVLGAKLESPDSPLPATASDPAIILENNEPLMALNYEIPGIFKTKTTGKLYAVQRSTNSYEATLDSSGELKGSIVDKTEQKLLKFKLIGIDVDLSSMKTPKIAQSSSGPNTIRFVKVADDATCETVESSLAKK